ncbi:MAG: aconitase/3-isopropylmalate dehydratase large subunit family protein, partial [Bacteroidota bacterium]|nr:aconitase/3-isopropylmalate dehydratase large subunit family protein [Bacteroidota bacterium]
MAGRTFVEKIFNAKQGSIVFAHPDIVLSHDNSSSIINTFLKMGGTVVKDPSQVMITLDHNAPPTDSKLANDYQKIRDFVKTQHINRFHDVGHGICHQLMALYALPGMIVVGSDSHTTTAGAFNSFAAGIDRTETAGLWVQGETWFRVPESIKITLNGRLPKDVYAKDLALWIIGMIGSDGADYKSVEFHGDGIDTLGIDERMTLCNLASEMGAKNAVFPADRVLQKFLNKSLKGVWADSDAVYCKEFEIDLEKIFPVIAVPHHVDNVKAVSEVRGTAIQQSLIGTCTNGRLEDLRIAASILKGHMIPNGFQMHIIPASREIYQQAMHEGLIDIFLDAGANVLMPSCGPCLGTGQGIPADNINVISTANRNFKGRMGNPTAKIFLASPAVVAWSSINGMITDPREKKSEDIYPYQKEQSATIYIKAGEDRLYDDVWNYADVDNLNTDQMFAGNLTYTINSSEGDKILPYLFKGFDDNFASRVKPDQIIIAGTNFGCGSSRE